MRLVVLYGSQTGTAQDVAEQIWRESKGWGFCGPVLPMDEFPVHLLIEQQLVIFVIATTGDGDEPDNMRQTWKFLLRRNLPAHSLEGLQFGCLGLGDSSYAKFNYAAKRLNKRLQQLGAKEILPLGLCDDQHDHGLSATSLPWMAQLWLELGKRMPLKREISELGDVSKRVFKWQVEVLKRADKLVDQDVLCGPASERGGARQHRFLLKENIRTTTEDHFQDVRLLRFQPPASDCVWNPGDVLDVRPCNSPEQINTFFQFVKEHQLGFNAATVVQLLPNFDDMTLPVMYREPITVGQLAQHVWDFNFKPRQRVFEVLALNCDDDMEKEKLEEFASAKGLDDLISYVNRPRRTILEVLQDFPQASSRLTLALLFELFPIIQPRSFSIASMPTSGSLDLLVAVVKYKTKMAAPRLGLCSNWLKNLTPGTRILGAFRTGTMTLPRSLTTPLIMVGPGTGIAPFRSIIQHLEAESQKGQPVGPLVVFFGCRNRLKDYHFADDFRQWQNDNFVDLLVAFSRDQDHKVYVQHLIREQKAKLSELIRKRDAMIYVAGSSNNMPKEVREAFKDVLDGDDEYMERMIKTKRYQEETWS